MFLEGGAGETPLEKWRWVIDVNFTSVVPDDKTLLQLDATIRLGHYHRLEFGYFDLARQSTTTLSNALDFGDERFSTGTTPDTTVDASFLRASYGYSLIKDAQKELGATIGVHAARMETDISAMVTGQSERSSASTPLPVIGAFASVFLSERTTMSARLQIYCRAANNYANTNTYSLKAGREYFRFCRNPSPIECGQWPMEQIALYSLVGLVRFSLGQDWWPERIDLVHDGEIGP